MTYTDARKNATINYIGKNLDSITFRLPKEKKDNRPTKDELKAHCEKYGYNGIQPFIIKAIQTQMQIDAGIIENPLSNIFDNAKIDE